MDKIFEHLSSSWIRYFDYEWRTAKDPLLHHFTVGPG